VTPPWSTPKVTLPIPNRSRSSRGIPGPEGRLSTGGLPSDLFGRVADRMTISGSMPPCIHSWMRRQGMHLLICISVVSRRTRQSGSAKTRPASCDPHRRRLSITPTRAKLRAPIFFAISTATLSALTEVFEPSVRHQNLFDHLSPPCPLIPFDQIAVFIRSSPSKQGYRPQATGKKRSQGYACSL